MADNELFDASGDSPKENRIKVLWGEAPYVLGSSLVEKLLSVQDGHLAIFIHLYFQKAAKYKQTADVARDLSPILTQEEIDRGLDTLSKYMED